VDTRRARENRHAELGHRRAADFGEAHAQQHLIAARPCLNLEQVDYIGRLVDVSGCDRYCLLTDVLARDHAREHHTLAIAGCLDVLVGEQLFHLVVQARQVPLHRDLVSLHGTGPIPHEHRDRPWCFPVDEQLALPSHQRVGDVGTGERHARDRRADVDERRTAHEQFD
jgi:hypothetical protein